jgi:hypothetical protein
MKEEPNRFVQLPPPTACALWEHPERAGRKFAEIFEEVESYEDSSHLSRALYKCRECGQQYFYEWYEWDGGNDSNYSTLIPVQTQSNWKRSSKPIYSLSSSPAPGWEHAGLERQRPNVGYICNQLHSTKAPRR